MILSEFLYEDKDNCKLCNKVLTTNERFHSTYLHAFVCERCYHKFDFFDGYKLVNGWVIVNNRKHQIYNPLTNVFIGESKFLPTIRVIACFIVGA